MRFTEPTAPMNYTDREIQFNAFMIEIKQRLISDYMNRKELTSRKAGKISLIPTYVGTTFYPTVPKLRLELLSEKFSQCIYFDNEFIEENWYSDAGRVKMMVADYCLTTCYDKSVMTQTYYKLLFSEIGRKLRLLTAAGYFIPEIVKELNKVSKLGPFVEFEGTHELIMNVNTTCGCTYKRDVTKGIPADCPTGMKALCDLIYLNLTSGSTSTPQNILTPETKTGTLSDIIARVKSNEFFRV